MTFTTRLTKASIKGSVRTSIPKAYVDVMDLTPGDTLEWDLTIDEKKNFYLTAKKGQWTNLKFTEKEMKLLGIPEENYDKVQELLRKHVNIRKKAEELFEQIEKEEK
jgi:bifunctional DNA-binding transcriptional regulator/antitoxin component of YhaV-PrlF toxin-antitoxin module